MAVETVYLDISAVFTRLSVSSFDSVGKNAWFRCGIPETSPTHITAKPARKPRSSRGKTCVNGISGSPN